MCNEITTSVEYIIFPMSRAENDLLCQKFINVEYEKDKHIHRYRQHVKIVSGAESNNQKVPETVVRHSCNIHL